MKDFSTKPAQSSEPISVREVTFSLDGGKAQFTARISSDADSILMWSELAGSAPGDTDLESPEGVAFVARYFQAALGDVEYRRFRAYLKGKNIHPDVLNGIMEYIEEQLREDVEDAAERPTTPSSPSSDGPGVKGERISTVASIEGAEVALAPRPNRQQRRAADRRQAAEARVSA